MPDKAPPSLHMLKLASRPSCPILHSGPAVGCSPLRPRSPGVGLPGVLEVRYDERLVGVDGAPVLRAHHARVHVESVLLATAAVTPVPVSVAAVAGVERAGDRVFVALHDVVLRAPFFVILSCIPQQLLPDDEIFLDIDPAKAVIRHHNEIKPDDDTNQTPLGPWASQ